MAESSMIHLAVENSPVEAAWAAFDAAEIRLHVMYELAALEADTMAGSAERRDMVLEVARLRKEFETLFFGDDAGPGEAA